jgi:hypothetical protein
MCVREKEKGVYQKRRIVQEKKEEDKSIMNCMFYLV